MEGSASGTVAQATADLYLALAELSAYRSTAQAAAVAEIAADRFGIHADTATASRLNDRAAQAWAAGEGGLMLDQLSRLARRARGVFYDGHRDRITAWDSSSGSMLLYTCTGPELRSAAAAAVDYGDLTLPVMRRQAVGSTYEPSGAEDPALVLAVAAHQLGRQAARALHPATPRERTVNPEPPAPKGGSASGVRTVSALTWVQPVSGAGESLELEQMRPSYTRYTAGPRSRAATTVREHLRRAPGTSKSEAPTIPVRAHPRRGTGAGAPAPKVTKVSARPQLWR